MKHTRLLAVCLVLSQAPGVLHAQNRQELQLSADVRMLQEQVSRLQLSANQLGDRMTALDKRLDAQDAASTKGFADQQLRVNAQTQALSVIREKLDDNNTRTAQLTQELTAVIASIRIINDQLSTLTNLLQPAVNPTDPDAPPAGPSPRGATALPPSPSSLFKQARNDYMSHRLDLAIEGFNEYLEKFPQSPDAAEAQLAIAHSYNLKNQYPQTLDAIAKVISTYKDAEQVPEAYYLRGTVYEAMKRPAEANATFLLITKQYVGSTWALLAAQGLARLGNK